MNSCPTRRMGRVRYGDAVHTTATIIASRTVGKAGESWSRRTTASNACFTSVWSTTTAPISRASTQATTPAMSRSRASRQRRATIAANTTMPNAHSAPTVYSTRNSESRSFGRPLTSWKRSSSAWVGSDQCAMKTTRRSNATTRRMRSLVRRRYGSSDAGPKLVVRQSDRCRFDQRRVGWCSRSPDVCSPTGCALTGRARYLGADPARWSIRCATCAHLT